MSRSSTLVDCLVQHGQRDPGRCAIVSGQLSLTYSDLVELVAAQQKGLEDAGVSKDSVVGIECADDAQHLLLCLATASLGATSCTTSSLDSPQQRDAFLRSAGVTVVVGEDLAIDLGCSERGPARALIAGEQRGATLLFCTSGTTGSPKIVCHHESNIVAQAHRHIQSPEERFACLAGMEHNFVKRHRLYTIARGATNVLLDPTQATLVRQCQDFQVTTLHLSVFQAQEMLAVPEVGELRALRLKLGGSHVDAALRRNLREHVTEELCCGYGTTETGAIAFTDPGEGDGAESVGQPLPGIEVRVVNEDRIPVEASERGEIAIRCDGLFDGYLNQPELTEKSLADGWFYTGDVARIDEQDRIHLCGRSDDMFVFNSLNIYPQDIEAQICQHPGVLDAAVLPKPSPVHGEVPVALVVLEGTESHDLGELKRFVRSHVGLRSPRQYRVVDRIPRNAAGKILRDDARALMDVETGR